MGDKAEPQPTKSEVLGAERAVNERYRRLLEQMVERSPELAKVVGASDGARWTGTGPKTGVSRSVVSPVVGRVGLHEEDDMLGKSFYVGGLWGRDWVEDGKDVYVVAWAAPLAKAFYDPDNCEVLSKSNVGGSRTFEVHGGDVRDFEDDLRPGVTDAVSVFPLPGAGAVAVPTAPRPVARPARASAPPTRPAPPARPAAPAAPPRPAAPVVPPTPAPPEPSSAPPQAPPVSEPVPPSPRTVFPTTEPEPLRPAVERDDAEPVQVDDPPPTEPTAVVSEQHLESPTPLRAEQSVRRAIEAPRTGRLGAVLSTLQPDQYQLVERPYDESFVVQGQPGTGKTIIATHRAAFLVHDGREERAITEVGLVGPTDAWAHHVAPSIEQLGVQGVRVLSLPGLLGTHAGVTVDRMAPGRSDRLDASWELADFLEEAIPVLRSRVIGKLSMQEAVKLLTTLDASLASLLSGRGEIRSWLREAKNWQVMTSNRRYLPALGLIGEELGQGPTGKLNHLVVDEAQDVRPMEWRVLMKRLRTGAGLTIVGDLNQRRSDWTYDSWQALGEQLDIVNSEGILTVEEISTGYRSTRRILKFANQLLPKHQRTVGALREGTDPVVKKVPSDQMTGEAYRAATALAAMHPAGQVAVIALAPKPISDRFRKEGWVRPAALQHAWTRDGTTVVVLHPEEARGLEFDGVVVIEPLEFPVNVGRIGSLYTSLTRATKDLTVLYSGRLPGGLRAGRK